MRISDWSSDVCSSDLLRRVALGQHLHLLAVDLDVVLAGLDLARVGAVHGIILQEVRVRLGGAKVVDGDELDVLALGLHGGAKHETTDPPEAVDDNQNCHSLRSEERRGGKACVGKCRSRWWRDT